MVWLDEAEDRAVVLRLDFRARTALHYFFNPTTFGSRHSARQDNNDQEHRRQNLKQNESQSVRAVSTPRGVN